MSKQKHFWNSTNSEITSCVRRINQEVIFYKSCFVKKKNSYRYEIFMNEYLNIKWHDLSRIDNKGHIFCGFRERIFSVWCCYILYTEYFLRVLLFSLWNSLMLLPKRVILIAIIFRCMICIKQKIKKYFSKFRRRFLGENEINFSI